MNCLFFTYYIILISLSSCLSNIYPLTVSFGDNSVLTFNAGQLVEFEIDNSLTPYEVQIIISIEDASANSCYQLLLSKTQIPLLSFQEKMLINSYYYQQDSSSSQKQFIDVDGLASCSKTLSAWLNQNPLEVSNSKLYAYLLGPYKFGTSSVNTTPSQPSYNAHFQILNSKTCINNCNQKGSCSSQRYCICNLGYISRDCSIEAIFWNISQSSEGNFQLNKGEKRYFAIDFTNQLNQISTNFFLYIQTSGESGFLFYSTQQAGVLDFQIPDYDYWSYNSKNQGLQMLSLNDQITETLLLKEQIKKYIEEQVTFIFMFATNSPSTQLTFKIGYQPYDSSVGQGLIILFVFLGIIVILILLYTFFVCKRKLKASNINLRSRQTNYLEQRQEQQIIGGQANNNNINNNNENRERKKSEQNTLSLKQINKYMPAKQFDQQLKDSCNVESCAVCLEDFANCKEKVRLTICQHLFHSDCLISWMEKQQNCPFCRHKLTLESLKQNNNKTFFSLEANKILSSKNKKFK